MGLSSLREQMAERREQRRIENERRALVDSYAAVLPYTAANVEVYVDVFEANGWTPEVLARASIIYRYRTPVVSRLAAFTDRFPVEVLDAWLPYLNASRNTKVHPALPIKPTWQAGSRIRPRQPIAELVTDREWATLLIDWHQAAGLLAPLAYATGFTLAEARAADMTADTLQVMLSLQGLRVEDLVPPGAEGRW